MIRGIYTAATGLFNQSRALDITGNNLANLGTAGFKRDVLLKRTFGEHLSYSTSPGDAGGPIGVVTHGVLPDETATQHGQGRIEKTGRSLDLAIEGEGYFTCLLLDGRTGYTRNGRFSLNENGILTDSFGNPVMGRNGPVRLADADFSVNAGGEIFTKDGYADTLAIFRPEDQAALEKQGNGIFTGAGGGAVEFGGEILQCAVESSNVDVMTEMKNMIGDSRSFQACARIAGMMDSLLEKAVQIGSLR